MTDLEAAVLADRVKALFPDTAPGGTVTNVTVESSTDRIDICIEQTGGLNLGFRELFALARLLDTDRFSIGNKEHRDGRCETCDYGSSDSVQISFNRADVGVFDSPGIKEDRTIA